jgi:hypothetical protein
MKQQTFGNIYNGQTDNARWYNTIECNYNVEIEKINMIRRFVYLNKKSSDVFRCVPSGLIYNWSMTTVFTAYDNVKSKSNTIITKNKFYSVKSPSKSSDDVSHCLFYFIIPSSGAEPYA